MPYGIPASRGGESALNTLRMERCVAGIKAKNQPGVNAYAVCKDQYGFTKAKAKSGNRNAH